MQDESLKNRAFKGMVWKAVEKIASTGISFIIGVILARILMPSDYGLIGMLAIFFAFTELFIDSGFSSALIQKKDRTEVDYSTIFYFNLIVSILLYLILFFSAPLIANFFNTPVLSVLTRVLSLNILFNSLSLVQQTRLTINLEFRTQAIVSLICVIISGSVGILMAYHGFGVWALVIQNITSGIVRTALYFFINKWIPKWIFSVSSFKQLFGFSSKLLGAGLLGAIFNNIYSLLIGKLFSAKDVGFYSRAMQFPQLLSDLFTTVLQGVTFPIMTSMQDDRTRLISVYDRLMRMSVFFVIPALTLFALVAEPFIRLLLTEKWMPVVPLIQWLCFARMITPISSLNMNILNTIGRSDLFFKVDVIKMPLAIVALIITLPLGLKAVVIGHLITTFINFFINAYYPGKIFGYGAIKQIKGMRLTIYATMIMVVCVFSMMIILHNDFLKLLICVPFGLSVYLFASYLMKNEEVNEVVIMANAIYAKIK